MREGDWKITKIYNNDWELFNLRTDKTELNNVSKNYPKRFNFMIDKWNLWANRGFVN